MPVYDSIQVGHNTIETEVLLDFLRRMGIKAFVEIGIHAGGLAKLLMDYGDSSGMEYRGIEISAHIIDDRIMQRGGMRIVAGDAYSEIVKEKIRTWLASVDGRSLIYCDGGNKVHDLEVYAPLVRRGHFIGVHDFGNHVTAEITPPQALRILGTACWQPVPLSRTYPDSQIAIWLRI